MVVSGVSETLRQNLDFSLPKTCAKLNPQFATFLEGSTMIFGYARVSTQEQSLDSQIDALKAAGAVRIFEEKISGSGKGRRQLERLIDQLQEGDAVVVTKYDRLARSLVSVSCRPPSVCDRDGFIGPC
jgi:hypothetical protein